MEKNKPTGKELRDYLKDAGFDEDRLNNKEMLELYEALELSKNASQVDEHRTKVDDTEISRSVIMDLRKNSVLVDDPTVDTQFETPDPFDSMEEELQSAFDKTKVGRSVSPSSKSDLSASNLNTNTFSNMNKYNDYNTIDTYNSIPTTHKALTKIDIAPIYKFPFYCRPEILALNYTAKECLIGEFHCKLLNDLCYHQKQSIQFAQWGKPIPSSYNFNGFLNKKLEQVTNDDSDVENENDTEHVDTFISRAGRQTKRKVYCENTPEINALEEKPQSSPKPNLSIRKRPNLSTFKNDEIIKRSKLFADSPSRSEKMFDKLFEDEHKKQESEQETENFINSLDNTIEEEDVDDIAEIVHSAEPFQKRRIEPPSHKRLGAKNKPSVHNAKGRTRISNKKSDTVIEDESKKYTPLETHSKSIIKKGVCPLCNEQFFQDELEDHAATCGEISENEISAVTLRKRRVGNKTITCEVCDTVFTLSADYEVHVKECIQQSKSKGIHKL